MTFMFKPTLSMKPYNSKKWFIMHDYVRPMYLDATSVKEALNKFRERVDDEYSISISDHALRAKQPMYRNLKNGGVKQIGYVITGKTMFRDDDHNCWSDQYIDVWLEIMQVTEFEDIA